MFSSNQAIIELYKTDIVKPFSLVDWLWICFLTIKIRYFDQEKAIVQRNRLNLNTDGNVGIIHYALFWNGNNSLQHAYFVNNGLQSASMNRSFLNVIHKMI